MSTLCAQLQSYEAIFQQIMLAVICRKIDASDVKAEEEAEVVDHRSGPKIVR
jgi:hypothetical protein